MTATIRPKARCLRADATAKNHEYGEWCTSAQIAAESENLSRLRSQVACLPSRTTSESA